MLDAEQETLNAQLSLLDAERALDTATFRLLATIGVFDVDGLDVPVDSYDETANLIAVGKDGFDRLADKIIPETIRQRESDLPDAARLERALDPR